MATLYNTRISDTYQGLIKSIDNLAITASLKELTDGTGNNLGLYVNTSGDFKVTSILEFGSLKDTGENIIISKFVDAADGISNNDNDTTIPTTAAIVDYVAAQITIEDLDFTGDTGSGQIDLDSQIFAIGGTTNEITTVASGQSITFSLDSTGVYLPDNSTAITQTAGDNSTKIATTSYVDTLDAASDLDITDGTNTGDVNLNTQSLSILGTTNEIDTVVSGQGVTIGLPSTINTNLVGNVTGNLTGNVSGDLTGNVTSTSVLANGVTATTQSSSDDSTKVATTAYVKGLNNASDLDFTTDSGSGAVVLNSETLSVVGTTNEIETSGTGQEIQIGLPSSISTNLIGNVTGNLTGNVVGDVTGDLTGNSAGTHTGAVIGNVTGNVTGDLTGNADTATAWQTSRDLSVTGQASATIIGVDGTSNVSAAITLDNNSVTSKVLTGLPSPAASSVLATDTIVQGIGKLQSQINGLAGGLRFMGSWDATNNNPNLVSGGGEATSGTTTSTTANKLVDSTASFTTTVTVGDKVINQVDGQNALVSNVDSDTTLSLDTDIMVSGEAYTIDNSPFITQGHYYVVNVGGTTSLNGISNWSVGDWVIAGANNEWTKLDHTQIDGTGTGDANDGNIPRFTASNIIGDSIIRETGGNLITVSGTLSTTGNLNAQGDFAINTNKFTTQASTGNVAFTGDLAINTNKFTVNATSGNTAIAGDITSGGNILLNGGVLYKNSGSIEIKAENIRIKGVTTNENLAGFNENGSVELFYDNVQKFQTTSTGISVSGTSSTFAGSVTSNFQATTSSGSININSSDPTIRFNRVGGTTDKSIYELRAIAVGGTNDYFQLRKWNDAQTVASELMKIDNSGNATFTGNVGIGGSPYANSLSSGIDSEGGLGLFGYNDGFYLSGNAYYDGAWKYKTSGFASKINSNSTGEVIISAAANGSADDAITWSHNVTIKAEGNVGIGTGNPQNKLDIEQSAAVSARLLATGATSSSLKLEVKGGATQLTTTEILANSSGALTFATGTTSSTERMRIDSSGNITQTASGNPQFTISGSDGAYTSILQINAAGGGGSKIIASGGTNNLSFETAGSEKMRIDSSGNVNIYGTDNRPFAITSFNTVSTGAGWDLDATSSNGVVTMSTAGTERMRIDSSGNVGINVDPSTQLHNLQKTNDRAGGFYTQLNGNTYGLSMFVNSGGYGILGSNGAYTTDVLTMDLNSGNVGIGKSPTDKKLELYSTGNTALRIQNSTTGSGSNDGLLIETGISNGDAIIWNYESANIKFGTSATERMSIDSSGNVTVTNGGLFLNKSDGAYISLQHNTSLKGYLGVANQVITGGFAGDIGLTATSNLIFGSNGSTERMRITGGGDVLISKQSSDFVTAGIELRDTGQINTSVNADNFNFYNPTAGVYRFFVSAAGAVYATSTSINAISDITLKENIKPLETGLNEVMKLQPKRFDWKNGDGKNIAGFVAQEVEEILPDLVSDYKYNDEETKKAIKMGDMIPTLVKAIQELKAEVDLLKKECKCKN